MDLFFFPPLDLTKYPAKLLNGDFSLLNKTAFNIQIWKKTKNRKKKTHTEKTVEPSLSHPSNPQVSCSPFLEAWCLSGHQQNYSPQFRGCLHQPTLHQLYLSSASHSLCNFAHASFWAVSVFELLHLVSCLFHFSDILFRKACQKAFGKSRSGLYFPDASRTLLGVPLQKRHWQDFTILLYSKYTFKIISIYMLGVDTRLTAFISRFKCFWAPVLCTVPIFYYIMRGFFI